MNYTNLMREMRKVFASATPNKQLVEQLSSTISSALRDCSPAQALAIATRLKTAAEDVRAAAAEAFIADLKVPAAGYNDGKNFSLDDLIFRIKTDADYRYAENDDLPETEGLRLTALEKLRDEYDALKQSRNRDINIRKKKILEAHPQMKPIEDSIRHTASFIGVKGEK